MAVPVDVPADINQVDETGWVWTLLSEAVEPELVRPGSVIVAGDATEPFLARVVDLVDWDDQDKIVHLEVIGVPN
jgi:hypothetical protein